MSWDDRTLSDLPLFGAPQRPRVEAPPFIHGSETSRQAAVAIRPAAGTLRARVLAAIEAASDGLTDEEGCEATGMNPSTWRPRRGELLVGGFIRDTGRTRKSASGREATIWAAAAGKHATGI